MLIFREEASYHISALPDLKQLMDTVHNVTEPGDHVRGNARQSWNKLTFQQDLKIELSELHMIHERFPKLFQPAFMLQAHMMTHFMGESWWSNKVRLIIVYLYVLVYLLLYI